MAKIGFAKDGNILYSEGMDFNEEKLLEEYKVPNVSFIAPLRRNKAPEGSFSCVGVTYKNKNLMISIYTNEDETIKSTTKKSSCYVYKSKDDKYFIARGKELENYIEKIQVYEQSVFMLLKPNIDKTSKEIISYGDNGIIFTAEEIDLLRKRKL